MGKTGQGEKKDSFEENDESAPSGKKKEQIWLQKVRSSELLSQTRRKSYRTRRGSPISRGEERRSALREGEKKQ